MSSTSLTTTAEASTSIMFFLATTTFTPPTIPLPKSPTDFQFSKSQDLFTFGLPSWQQLPRDLNSSSAKLIPPFSANIHPLAIPNIIRLIVKSIGAENCRPLQGINKQWRDIIRDARVYARNWPGLREARMVRRTTDWRRVRAQRRCRDRIHGSGSALFRRKSSRKIPGWYQLASPQDHSTSLSPPDLTYNIFSIGEIVRNILLNLLGLDVRRASNINRLFKLISKDKPFDIHLFRLGREEVKDLSGIEDTISDSNGIISKTKKTSLRRLELHPALTLPYTEPKFNKLDLSGVYKESAVWPPTCRLVIRYGKERISSEVIRGTGVTVGDVLTQVEERMEDSKNVWSTKSPKGVQMIVWNTDVVVVEKDGKRNRMY